MTCDNENSVPCLITQPRWTMSCVIYIVTMSLFERRQHQFNGRYHIFMCLDNLMRLHAG